MHGQQQAAGWLRTWPRARDVGATLVTDLVGASRLDRHGLAQAAEQALCSAPRVECIARRRDALRVWRQVSIAVKRARR